MSEKKEEYTASQCYYDDRFRVEVLKPKGSILCSVYECDEEDSDTPRVEAALVDADKIADALNALEGVSNPAAYVEACEEMEKALEEIRVHAAYLSEGKISGFALQASTTANAALSKLKQAKGEG